jgi:hypothetical protein
MTTSSSAPVHAPFMPESKSTEFDTIYRCGTLQDVETFMFSGNFIYDVKHVYAWLDTAETLVAKLEALMYTNRKHRRRVEVVPTQTILFDLVLALNPAETETQDTPEIDEKTAMEGQTHWKAVKRKRQSIQQCSFSCKQFTFVPST